MGKEAAGEIEKQAEVIDNRELNAYISSIGSKLAAQPQADKYPYTFKVVNDTSINAFALPGGPAFVHTGLIAAVDNEAQLAGVLAHEITHVALRHGTNQASRANLIPFGQKTRRIHHARHGVRCRWNSGLGLAATFRGLGDFPGVQPDARTRAGTPH